MNWSNFVKAVAVGTPEDRYALWEVTKNKKTVSQSLPVQLGATVLCISKLKILEYYYDNFRYYLEDKLWEPFAMDTNSCIVTLGCDTLDECMKHKLAVEFAQKRDQMFVPENGPMKAHHTKTPLLLKVESEADFGVALCLKSYYMPDKKGTYKAAVKGLMRLERNEKLLTLLACSSSYWGRWPKAEAAPIAMSTVFLSHLFRFRVHFSPNERIETKFGKRKLGTICSSDTKTFSNWMLTSQLISFQRLAHT